SLGRGGSDDELLAQIEAAIADPRTTLLIVCLESLTRGRDFLSLTARAAARHLPVVLLRVGACERFGERMSRSHPGAAWTDRTMWDSVAGQYGVVLLDDAQQIVDLGKLASSAHATHGKRVAVLAMSEGIAMMQGDQCEAAGLDVTPFSAALREKIASRLPSWACAENPADVSESVFADEKVLDGVIADVEASGECDMLLVAAGALTPRQGEILAHALCAAHRRGRLPLACCCLSRWHPLENMVRRLNAEGVPLFSSPRRVAEAMASLWRIGRAVPSVLPLRDPAKKPFLDDCPPSLSERDAMALAEHYGLKTAPHRLCSSVAEVLEAARKIGFPLALKVVSPSFASKQQARAVALNLKTEEELRNAYGRILERVSRVHPEAEVQGVFAQKMISDGIECMIGVKRDRLFGPVVAVALGGAYYGLMKDIALRVAPVSVEEAQSMIESLKGYPLVSGAWFGRVNDVEALARQIAALSEMACDEPDIEVLDINPIFVRPKGLGAEIADAFAVRRKRG
ncbi:MAG: acetate--CoA ligase family protein, partial [Pyramidobacter sp.]|nr:acetate--CoA ligase family protein [Pyramidobacter sp.]